MQEQGHASVRGGVCELLGRQRDARSETDLHALVFDDFCLCTERAVDVIVESESRVRHDGVQQANLGHIEAGNQKVLQQPSSTDDDVGAVERFRNPSRVFRPFCSRKKRDAVVHAYLDESDPGGRKPDRRVKLRVEADGKQRAVVGRNKPLESSDEVVRR